MNQYRDTNIDVLRAIAIIIVVFGHSLLVSLGDNQGSSVLRLIQTFQMPLLFAISGYSLGFAFPITTHYGSFIWKKAIRLYVPYLAWATLHYLINGRIYNYSFNIKDYVVEMFHSDFWFLRELFIYMLIVICISISISIFTKNRGIILAFTCIFAILAFIVFKLEIYMFSFVWGLILYEIMHSEIWNVMTRNVIARRMVFSVLNAILIYYLIMVILGRQQFASSFVITNSIFMIICLVSVKVDSKYVDFVAEIGKNTLGIYAIHWCLLFSTMVCLNIPNILIRFIPVWISAIILGVVWLIISDILIRMISLSGALSLVLLGQNRRI